MNKLYSIISLAFLMALGTLLMSNSTGSPGGRTGSPTDGSTCGVSGCHGAQTPTPIEMISSDIPVTGYKPDSTYEITVSPSKEGITKFGFEMVAEDDNGTKVGVFTDNAEVTAWIGDQRVTHKSTSTSATNGTRSWTVNWKAPAEGTGQVTFYAASLAANDNGNNSGDSVLIDNMEVQEMASTLNLVDRSPVNIKAYPNPFTDHIRIDGVQLGTKFSIHSIDGKQVLSGSYNGNIEVKDLAQGHYYLRIKTEGKTKDLVMIKK